MLIKTCAQSLPSSRYLLAMAPLLWTRKKKIVNLQGSFIQNYALDNDVFPCTYNFNKPPHSQTDVVYIDFSKAFDTI
jgi:hypothetical protein